MSGQENRPEGPEQQTERATEPLPSNWKPALRFFLFILGVTATMALVAIIVDRALYG